jgi:hypothetical protein
MLHGADGSVPMVPTVPPLRYVHHRDRAVPIVPVVPPLRSVPIVRRAHDERTKLNNRFALFKPSNTPTAITTSPVPVVPNAIVSRTNSKSAGTVNQFMHTAQTVCLVLCGF